LLASTLNFGLDDAIERPLVRFDATRLRRLSPGTRTLPSFRRIEELDVAESIYDRWPTLDFDKATAVGEPSNPWVVTYCTLFHSSSGQKYFDRREELEAAGFTLQRDREMQHADGRIAVPVYEGQMVTRWDHRAKTYEGYLGDNKYGSNPGIPSVSEDQHSDPEFEVEPRYWMLWNVAKKRLDKTVGDRALIAFRDITRQWKDRRCVKAAVVAPGPATHTLPILATTHDRAMGLAALLNSTTVDFLAKLHLPGAHLQAWTVSQIAAPPPDELDAHCWGLAEKLSATSRKLAAAYGYELHSWCGDVRHTLEAECDARVARAYGIKRDEYEVILDSFTAMARRETFDDGLGEYRTKRLCLDAWDRLVKETA
jgi:hypothetical protein